MVSHDNTEKALDPTFIAVISGSNASVNDEQWPEADADQRLNQHINWMKTRQQLLAEGLTAGQLTAIFQYVSNKNGSSAGQIKATLSKELVKVKMTLGRLKRALTALGFVSIPAGIGWMHTPSAAAPTLPPITTSGTDHAVYVAGGGLNERG